MRKSILVLVSSFLILKPYILSAQESETAVEAEAESAVEEQARITEFEACSTSVLQLVQNASGTLFAAADENSLAVYDAKDFSLIKQFYDGKLARISFYTEGESEFLAAITTSGQFIVRKLMQTYDGWAFEEGEPYYSADCSDVSGRKSLTAVSFSSNSDYVAAAFDDNSVQVHFRLRITAGSISRTITAHKAPVYALEFSKNGEYLATVSTDGESYIWNSYTGAKIAHIKGSYARARIPVCFTEDSVYIVSLDGRNSFRISDFSGNTLYSILTGRPITAIKPLKDPDLIAIRNDKNEVMIYSISSRRPLSVYTVNNEKAFTAFEFKVASELMYAGFSDGHVCLIEAQPYLDDTAMLITDASLAGKGAGNFIHQRFTSLSVCGGTNYMTKPYLLSANLRGEYLYAKAISPFFVGGGLALSVGFPREDYPSNYKVSGQEVDAPKLLSATVYAPVGYAFSPWNNDIRILTSFKFGAKSSSLALFTSQGNAIGNPALSFFLGVGAGMQIRWFTFDVNCEYDTMGKVSPSIYAGYNFRFEEKK